MVDICIHVYVCLVLALACSPELNHVMFYACVIHVCCLLFTLCMYLCVCLYVLFVCLVFLFVCLMYV